MEKRSAQPQQHGRSNLGRVRAKGMRSISRVTRMTTAASLVLSVVFSAVAALGFAGNAGTTASKGAGSRAPSVGNVNMGLVALPPKGSGGTLAPPATLPVAQNAPASVTSGGS